MIAVSSETPVEEAVLIVPLLPLTLCCRSGLRLGDRVILLRRRLDPGTDFRREMLYLDSSQGCVAIDSAILPEELGL